MSSDGIGQDLATAANLAKSLNTNDATKTLLGVLLVCLSKYYKGQSDQKRYKLFCLVLLSFAFWLAVQYDFHVKSTPKDYPAWFFISVSCLVAAFVGYVVSSALSDWPNSSWTSLSNAGGCVVCFVLSGLSIVIWRWPNSSNLERNIIVVTVSVVASVLAVSTTVWHLRKTLNARDSKDNTTGQSVGIPISSDVSADSVEDQQPDVPWWTINVPLRDYDVTQFFIGRCKDLEDGEKHLLEGASLGVCGLAGVGKTSLVVKLLYQLKCKYDIVLWIQASSVESLTESLSKISDVVNAERRYHRTQPHRAKNRVDPHFHVQGKVKAVKQWITHTAEQRKMLVVIDDYNKASCFAHVRSLLPDDLLNDKKLHVVVTSQESDLDDLRVHKIIDLTPLANEDAVRLIIKWAQKYKFDEWTGEETEMTATKKIAAIVDGLPLAVEQAAVYIGKIKMLPSQYVTEISDSKDENLLLKKPVSGEGRSVEVVFERNFKEISKNAVAKELMGIIAFCSADPIPLQLFSLGCDDLAQGNALRKVAKDVAETRRTPLKRRNSRDVPRQYFEVFEKLSQYHLVTVCSKSQQLRVHSITQKLYKRHLSAEEQRKSIAALSTLLAAVFEESPADRWQFYSALFPHVMSCCRKMKKRNLYNANLLLHAGRRLSLSPLFREARKILKTFLVELDRNVEQRNSYQVALARHSLASAQRRLGNFDKAIEEVQQALEIWSQLKETKMEARSKELCAEILVNLCEFESAEQLMNKAKPLIIAQSTDTDRYEKSSCHGVLGVAYFEQKKYNSALKEFKQAANCLGKEAYFRYHLYQAKRFLTEGMLLLETSQFAKYENVFGQCRTTLKELESYYSSKHRYHSWLRREMARLQVEECRRRRSTREWSKGTSRKQLISTLEMAKSSLEDQIDLFTEKHGKVAKAAAVVALVCLEHAKTCQEKHASHSAALACLELAVQIWTNIESTLPPNEFPAVGRKIKELQKSQGGLAKLSLWERLFKKRQSNKSLPAVDTKSVESLATDAKLALDVLLIGEQNSTLKTRCSRNLVGIIFIILAIVVFLAIWFCIP